MEREAESEDIDERAGEADPLRELLSTERAEMVERAVLTLPMLQTFDSPDTATSCPRREASTVAPQALTLMNGDFTLAQADKFAARLRKESGDEPDALVSNGWRIAFGRLPSTDERQTALSYLQRNSLPRLCLLIFNMSEFIYVD